MAPQHKTTGPVTDRGVAPVSPSGRIERCQPCGATTPNLRGLKVSGEMRTLCPGNAGIETWPSARSSYVRGASRCSGDPSSTPVSQVPHTPSRQDVGTSMPALANASTALSHLRTHGCEQPMRAPLEGSGLWCQSDIDVHALRYSARTPGPRHMVALTRSGRSTTDTASISTEACSVRTVHPHRFDPDISHRKRTPLPSSDTDMS